MKRRKHNDSINSSDIICLTKIDKTNNSELNIDKKTDIGVQLYNKELQNTLIDMNNNILRNDVYIETNKGESDNKFETKIHNQDLESNAKYHEDLDKCVNKKSVDLKNNKEIDFIKSSGVNSFIRNDDLSTSILEIPFKVMQEDSKDESLCIKNYHKNKETFLPSFYDPLFHGCIINFPISMEFILKKQDVIGFSYHIDKSITRFTITRNSCEIFSCLVLNYNEHLQIENTAKAEKIIFILKRKNYLQKEKKKETERFKKSLKEKLKYIKEDTVKQSKHNLFKHQIENGINMIFIENYDDLVTNLKAIVKSLDEKKEYHPKVKTFNENMQREHLEYVISSIPGISKNVAVAVGNKFDNFAALFKYIELNCNEKTIDEISNLCVMNDEKTSTRKIGPKSAYLIIKALTEENPDVLLKES